jgi:hypothetical protein
MEKESQFRHQILSVFKVPEWSQALVSELSVSWLEFTDISSLFVLSWTGGSRTLFATFLYITT